MKPFVLFLTFAIAIFAETFNRDLYEMLASDAENRADYNASAKYRRAISENGGGKINRDRWIEALLRMERYEETIVETKAALAKEGEDDFLRRSLAVAFFGKRDLKNAIAAAKMLAKNDGSIENYLLLGDFYAINNENRNALAAFRKAYSIAPVEVAIDKIATILVDRMKKPKEAIAYYETHIVERGCSEYFCSRLASLYAKENDAGGVASAYKRIYKYRSDPVIGQKIVELYLIDKDYKSLIRWLEESRFDDEILLELYKNEKRFGKASKIAAKLYEASGKIDYLALSAMFEYEAGDSGDREVINRTIRSLEKVVSIEKNHIYLNYLGYLLIDHNIDIERGLNYVKLALKSDPNNVYYTDSLAWGYYRMGRLKEAYDLIAKVAAKEKSDPTVREHYDEIKKSYDLSLTESSE
jgi:predicted Zn-dependent protease